MKRIISVCLFLMLLATLPLTAFAADALSSVRITGLTHPVAGATPDLTAEVDADIGKVTAVRWMDLWTDSYISATDRFIYEKDADGNERNYRVEIDVEITDRYLVVTDNTTGTVNGMEANVKKEDDYHFTVEIDLLPTQHTCSGGYASCVEAAKCAICGKEYGQPDPEAHDVRGYMKEENDAKLQTHHDVKCDLCKKTLYEEAHNFGEPDHNEALPCIICWYRLPKGEGVNKPGPHTCSGGTATCHKGPICTVCGKEYGRPDESKHELMPAKKESSDPKYATHHDLKCEVCNKIVREEEHALGPENAQGVKPCIQCWYTPEANIAPHTCSGGEANCSEQAYCTICNMPYGEVDPNGHRYGDSYAFPEDDGHAKACQICGEASELEAHVPDDTDQTICKLCGYPIPQDAAWEDSEGKNRGIPGIAPLVIVSATAVIAGGATVTAVMLRKGRIKKG